MWSSKVVFLTCFSFFLSCTGQYSRKQLTNFNNKVRRLPALDVCGKVCIFEDRVIDGKPAQLGAYPWMATIGYKYRSGQSPQWLCAGTIITDQWVLTAAHCIEPSTLQAKRRWEATTIHVGDLDLDPTKNDKANPVDHEIEKIIYHEEYSNDRKINDIGLIKTKTKMQFNCYVRPICLPPYEFSTNEYTGKLPIVAGWGKSVQNQPRTETRLLEASVEIKDREECRRNITSTNLLRNAIIDDRVLCASSPGKDSCQGDSGGPLMMFARIKNPRLNSTGNMFIMGVVSYGYGCAVEGYPGVYTRVSKYMNWIMNNLDI